MTAREVAAFFPGGKWRGETYETHCSAHPDRHPSLGISPAKNGGVVIHCQAGCEPAAVLAAVGLSLKDLAPPPVNGSRPLEPEAVYRYDDERGEPLYEKVRLPGKQFFLRLPGGNGGGIGDVRRVLFGLPELLATKPGETVAIVEGEKDALNVRKRGVAATTNPEGAAKAGQRPKWRPEYTEWLKGNLSDRRFAVFADQDEAGLAHAEAVVASLKAAGLTVAAVNLGGLAEKEDVSDWLGRHSDEEFLALLAPRPHGLDLLVRDGEALDREKIPEPESLIPHLLYRGFLTLLAGDSKLGKSSLELRALLASASGGWWLDRERRPENRLERSRILYINFEDPLFVTRDRARKMMAPEGLPKNWLSMPPPYGYSLSQILDWLHEAHQRWELDAVVLDPIAIAAEWADETDNAEIARTLKPIQRLAAETMLGILIAHHVTKKPGQYGLNIRGASAIKANVLGYLVLEREKELFKLSGINKLAGEWDVTLDRSQRDWSWWIVESRSGSTQTVAEGVRESIRGDLLSLIESEPLITTDRLAEWVSLNRRTCLRHLRALEEEGLALGQELRQPGVPGRPETGWMLGRLSIGE